MLTAGLDHVRHEALAVPARPTRASCPSLAVLLQVEVAAVRDALELRPADRVEVLEVARGARVVRQLLRRVLADAQPALAEPVADVPPHALLDPVPIPLLASAGGTKYSISICSNSRTRNRKLPGVISLRNDLPTFAMPNGGLRRASCATFLKLMKMPCAVSGRR